MKDNKDPVHEALAGLAMPALLGGLMTKIIGDTMFGTDNSKTIEDAMAGIVNAFLAHHDVQRDEIQRKDEENEKIRKEAAQLQEQIYKQENTIENLKEDLENYKEELKAAKKAKPAKKAKKPKKR
jgi:septin family protein